MPETVKRRIIKQSSGDSDISPVQPGLPVGTGEVALQGDTAGEPIFGSPDVPTMLTYTAADISPDDHGRDNDIDNLRPTRVQASTMETPEGDGGDGPHGLPTTPDQPTHITPASSTDTGGVTDGAGSTGIPSDKQDTSSTVAAGYVDDPSRNSGRNGGDMPPRPPTPPEPQDPYPDPSGAGGGNDAESRLRQITAERIAHNLGVANPPSHLLGGIARVRVDTLGLITDATILPYGLTVELDERFRRHALPIAREIARRRAATAHTPPEEVRLLSAVRPDIEFVDGTRIPTADYNPLSGVGIVPVWSVANSRDNFELNNALLCVGAAARGAAMALTSVGKHAVDADRLMLTQRGLELTEEGMPQRGAYLESIMEASTAAIIVGRILQLGTDVLGDKVKPESPIDHIRISDEILPPGLGRYGMEIISHIGRNHLIDAFVANMYVRNDNEIAFTEGAQRAIEAQLVGQIAVLSRLIGDVLKSPLDITDSAILNALAQSALDQIGALRFKDKGAVADFFEQIQNNHMLTDVVKELLVSGQVEGDTATPEQRISTLLAQIQTIKNAYSTTRMERVEQRRRPLGTSETESHYLESAQPKIAAAVLTVLNGLNEGRVITPPVQFKQSDIPVVSQAELQTAREAVGMIGQWPEGIMPNSALFDMFSAGVTDPIIISKMIHHILERRLIVDGNRSQYGLITRDESAFTPTESGKFVHGAAIALMQWDVLRQLRGSDWDVYLKHLSMSDRFLAMVENETFFPRDAVALFKPSKAVEIMRDLATMGLHILPTFGQDSEISPEKSPVVATTRWIELLSGMVLAQIMALPDFADKFYESSTLSPDRDTFFRSTMEMVRRLEDGLISGDKVGVFQDIYSAVNGIKIKGKDVFERIQDPKDMKLHDFLSYLLDVRKKVIHKIGLNDYDFSM